MDADKFWSLTTVQPNGCRTWNRSTRQGYGQVRWSDYRATPVSTHRVAFFLTYGWWPLVVMHRCDNRPCCEPTHLEAGTILENNRDMWAKGRESMPPTKAWCALHPDTPENRAPNGPGKWRCRACKNAKQRAAYHETVTTT